jgi:hypothetical protein
MKSAVNCGSRIFFAKYMTLRIALGDWDTQKPEAIAHLNILDSVFFNTQ